LCNNDSRFRSTLILKRVIHPMVSRAEERPVKNIWKDSSNEVLRVVVPVLATRTERALAFDDPTLWLAAQKEHDVSLRGFPDGLKDLVFDVITSLIVREMRDKVSNERGVGFQGV